TGPVTQVCAPLSNHFIKDRTLFVAGVRLQSWITSNFQLCHSSGTVQHSGNSSVDSTNDSLKSSNSRVNLRTTSMSNFANQAPSESMEFLAPVNFDDFHNSIMAEPSLNQFP